MEAGNSLGFLANWDQSCCHIESSSERKMKLEKKKLKKKCLNFFLLCFLKTSEENAPPPQPPPPPEEELSLCPPLLPLNSRCHRSVQRVCIESYVLYVKNYFVLFSFILNFFGLVRGSNPRTLLCRDAIRPCVEYTWWSRVKSQGGRGVGKEGGKGSEKNQLPVDCWNQGDGRMSKKSLFF